MQFRPLALAALLAASIGATPGAGATTTLFAQPATPASSAAPFQVSATLWPDGLDSDYRVWDNFLLARAATVTGLRWQGQAASSLNLDEAFDIAFYTDISSLPYNLNVLHYQLSSVLQPDVGGTALQSFRMPVAALTVRPSASRAGTWDYAYDFQPGQSLALDGQRAYWVSIQAHQDFANSWSLATGAGDARGFVRGPAFYAGDVSYFRSNLDVAFSLVGVQAAVPEAGTAALLAAGLALLALAGQRRRKASC